MGSGSQRERKRTKARTGEKEREIRGGSQAPELTDEDGNTLCGGGEKKPYGTPSGTDSLPRAAEGVKKFMIKKCEILLGC